MVYLYVSEASAFLVYRLSSLLINQDTGTPSLILLTGGCLIRFQVVRW